MAVSERFPAFVQPLIGAVLGLCGAGLIIGFRRGPGAVAALVLWTAASLATGERGFARWFPKLPRFGMLMAGCTILLRWYSLISLETSVARLTTSVIAAMTLGPAASVALAWLSRPVDTPAFKKLARLSSPAAIVAVVEGTAAAMACGLRMGALLTLSTYLLLRLVSGFVNWRYGGIRASDLDGFRIVVETSALVILSSMRPE